MAAIVAAGVAFVVGLALGLFGFKIRIRWCQVCGNSLGCPQCAAGRRASSR